jgi:flagellin
MRKSGNELQSVQKEASSGLRTSDAADDAAYWSIATTMRSDHKALGAVKDSMAVASAMVDTASTSLASAIEVMSEIKSKLVMASEPGVDKTKVNAEINELKGQLTSINKSSYMFGQSFLYDNEASEYNIIGMVTGFTRSASGDVSVEATDYNTDGSTLIDNYNAANGILTRPVWVTQPSGTINGYYLIEGQINVSGTPLALSASTSQDDLQGMVKAADIMLQQMINAGAKLGALQSRLDLQTEFTTRLMDTIQAGVGKLVDADMNETAAQLKSLEVKQQLQQQSLSIANGSSDSLLNLFR